jgi:hypothetical protein
MLNAHHGRRDDVGQAVAPGHGASVTVEGDTVWPDGVARGKLGVSAGVQPGAAGQRRLWG